MCSETLRSRPRRTRTVRVGAMLCVAVAVGLTGCSGDDGASKTGASKTGATSDPTTTTLADDSFCPPTMPGEVMTASDAVVKFRPTSICPGYVTVKAGTKVTFANLDNQPATVNVVDGPSDAAKVVFTVDIDGGKSASTSFDQVTVLYYKVSSIESFRGVIEVK